MPVLLLLHLGGADCCTAAASSAGRYFLALKHTAGIVNRRRSAGAARSRSTSCAKRLLVSRVEATENYGPELVQIDPDGAGSLDGSSEDAFGPLVSQRLFHIEASLNVLSV